MKEHIRAACELLDKIYTDRTYADRVFDGEDASALSTRLVFGVLERDTEISYILDSLVDKQPKRIVRILLKVGVYALLYIDNIPDYAIVNECVETAKAIGKGGAAGFVNAVLKKVSTRSYTLPAPSDPDYLSVHFSKPQWFVGRMTAEYGEARTRAVLEEPASDLVHIRVNSRSSSDEAVKKLFDAHAHEYYPSAVGGFLVRVTPLVRSLFSEGIVTYQSPSSVLAVDALAPGGRCEVLDLCSAPGGKAVYASELAPAATVTACDVHPHRVELIKKYAARMGADNVRPVLSDATVFEPRFEGRFDFVMADVPCTCFGTFKKHPDVFLQRGEEAIAKLAATQRRIIDNAVRYLKPGGVMVYSTCTLFKEENIGNAGYAEGLGLSLEKMPVPFDNDGTLQLLPRGEWDGFFIARFRK